MIKCKKCGKENPDDSNFCQYCGSSDLEKGIIDVKVKPKNKKYSKTLIIISIISCILLVISLVFNIYLYSNYSEINEELDEISKQNDILKTAKNDKDKLIRIKGKINNRYNNYFYADKNILYRPSGVRVRIIADYNGSFTNTYSCPSSVKCEWYDDYEYDNIMWLEISYYGSDVEVITVTNDKIDEKIEIVVFG